MVDILEAEGTALGNEFSGIFVGGTRGKKTNPVPCWTAYGKKAT